MNFFFQKNIYNIIIEKQHQPTVPAKSVNSNSGNEAAVTQNPQNLMIPNVQKITSDVADTNETLNFSLFLSAKNVSRTYTLVVQQILCMHWIQTTFCFSTEWLKGRNKYSIPTSTN